VRGPWIGLGKEVKDLAEGGYYWRHITEMGFVGVGKTKMGVWGGRELGKK